MAYTTIKKPSDYFNTKLYTGNGTDNHAITDVNFEPDFVWIKPRNEARGHALFDTVRGATKMLISNEISAEGTYPTSLKSFDSDGFTLGTSNDVNKSANTHVAWNWLGGGTASSNTDGSITSTVSANTTSGFSIVKYTGTGSNATVGHGLGVAPAMIHVKGINVGTTNWLTGGSNISSNWGSSLHLNTTGGLDTYNYWQDQAPSTSTFAIGTDGANNQSGINFIAYCFAEKKGFSKFGSYVGNGNADGTFVYTGFKPAWVMRKYATGGTAAGEGWEMLDGTRSSFNVADKRLKADSSGAESTGSNYYVDFLSNGFKCRTADNATNNSGATYIYMAFAEEPLVGDNPATAR